MRSEIQEPATQDTRAHGEAVWSTGFRGAVACRRCSELHPVPMGRWTTTLAVRGQTARRWIRAQAPCGSGLLANFKARCRISFHRDCFELGEMFSF